MNLGEKAELQFIISASILRGKMIKFRNDIPLFINTVKIPVGDRLVSVDVPNSINVDKIANLSDEKLQEFCNFHSILKAGPFSKADIYLNDIGYSLKYSGSQPAAIINHTARPGWENVAKYKGVDIKLLDQIIDHYWILREEGKIKEDIKNSETNSPFRLNYSVLYPYLEYFSFEGSGSRHSNNPAAYLIEFNNPFNPNTWIVKRRDDFLRDIWPKLIFSLRSKKGMPPDINSNKIDPLLKKSVLRWSKFHQGSLRGSLHVRISNS